MNKKKIESFGTFCDLIANEPENVYCDDGIRTTKRKDQSYLHKNFINNTYYHIPSVKKKTMAMYYDEKGRVFAHNVNALFCSRWTKIPNTEFEVDE